uniref:Uncharacterized protein n=1 Tax=Anguilla anguilla TaxID=7936 RepID=A0A0E9TN41_ANGAN
MTSVPLLLKCIAQQSLSEAL